MDIINRYRDNQSSSSDDSEDSDKECTVWKRATAVKRMAEDEDFEKEKMVVNNNMCETTTKPKRKKNTIWTEVLQDQLISEDLEDCLLKNKPAHYDSRGKESYDYTLKYKDPRIVKDTDYTMDEVHSDEERDSLPPQYSSKKKYIKLDGAEHTAARKIIKMLNEKKVYLIQRIVKIVGIEKAMTLLNMTEQIEESGGMMVKNNARRRTPGGVYLQLLKSDKDVTQEMLDKIFEGEMSCVELKKYYADKKKKRKQFFKQKRGKQLKENTESNGSESCDLTMDAEETEEVISSPQNSSLENNPIPVPIPIKNSSDNFSDLEEGEIED